MELGLLGVARVLLAAVFAVAAVAKHADLPGARRALGAFGFPTAWRVRRPSFCRWSSLRRQQRLWLGRRLAGERLRRLPCCCSSPLGSRSTWRAVVLPSAAASAACIRLR